MDDEDSSHYIRYRVNHFSSIYNVHWTGRIASPSLPQAGLYPSIDVVIIVRSLYKQPLFPSLLPSLCRFEESKQSLLPSTDSEEDEFPYHTIVIDCAPIVFVDSMGANILEQVSISQ